MKKRLLSAALALAMVLTMLPLSALPVSAAAPTDKAPPDGTTVTYLEKDDPATERTGGKWYWSETVNNVTTWYEAGSTTCKGVIEGQGNSGRWHATPNKDASSWHTTSFTLLGDLSIDAGVAINGTLTVDTNGHTLTIGNAANGTCTRMTITDRIGAKDMSKKGTVTFTGGMLFNASNTMRSFVLEASNVKLGNAITMTGNFSHTVTLKNVEATGAITLQGYDSDLTKQTSQNFSITGAGSTLGGNVTVSGTNSRVTISDTVQSANVEVSVNGAGTVTEISGTTNIGSLKLFGSAAINGKAATGSAPTLNLYGGTVNYIQKNSGVESLTDSYKINIGRSNGNSTATVGVQLSMDNAVVNAYPGAKVGLGVGSTQGAGVTLNSGSLTLHGNTEVGPLTLNGTGNTTFTVNGSDNKVGEVNASNPGSFTISTPAKDRTNVFGELKLGTYAGKGIKGGTVGTRPNTAALKAYFSDDVLFVRTFTTPSVGYAVYSRDELTQCLADAGSLAAGEWDNNGAAKSIYICLIGQSAKTVLKLKNGEETWGAIGFDSPETIILPDRINGKTVANWVNENGSWAAKTGFPVTGKETGTALELNMQEGTTNVSKLTNAAANVAGTSTVVDAKLVGNTIRLSGAVDSTNAVIELKLTTDVFEKDNSDGTKKFVEVNVNVQYSTSGTIFNRNTSLRYGMSFADDKTIRLSNGTTYTLDGSGLRTKANITTTSGGVEATVNISNFTEGEIQSLLNKLTNAGGLNYANSPALRQAINAAEATITPTQVTQWIAAAQRAAYTKKNGDTYTTTKGATTGYDKVVLVPYIHVTATVYNQASGTLTLTMVPSYRVEVQQTTPGSYAAYTNIFKETAATNSRFKNTTVDNSGNYIAQTGRSLGTLTGDVGTITVTFNDAAMDTSLKTGWMHQNGTYAYKGAASAFAITHAGTNGLGTMVINQSEPQVKLYDKKGSGNQLLNSYDTLQAAVDDTVPRAENSENYIEVGAGYKATETINVTGESRKFLISVKGATQITSNASASLVDVTKTGNDYTVQLLKNVAVITNATISVGSAANGTARVNVTTAAQGSTVSGTYTANGGYRAGAFSATAATPNGNVSVSVSVGTNGTFSFTVPSNATSVTVYPSFVRVSTLPFTDVSTTAWYYTGVEYCYNTVRGSSRLMQGMNTANTIFSPNTGFNRAQVVQILWNIKGRPAPRYTYNRFSDISSIHYAYSAMLWAVENGYVEGYPNGTFRPDQPVTRQEMAVFLWRAAGKPTNYNNLNLNAYTDGYMVYDWAQSAMKWAIGRGVLSGQGSVALGSYLAPRTVAYRSEVAVTVMNFDKLAVFR